MRRGGAPSAGVVLSRIFEGHVAGHGHSTFLILGVDSTDNRYGEVCHGRAKSARGPISGHLPQIRPGAGSRISGGWQTARQPATRAKARNGASSGKIGPSPSPASGEGIPGQRQWRRSRIFLLGKCSARLALQPCSFSTAPWSWQRGPNHPAAGNHPGASGATPPESGGVFLKNSPPQMRRGGAPSAGVVLTKSKQV